MTELHQSPWNFLALPAEYSLRDRARAWVLPVPYEATTSYGAGTRRGPAAIIEASRQVETYDRRFGCEPCCKYGIATLPAVEPDHTSPQAMVDRLECVVDQLYTDSRSPELLITLGGEHSISVGTVRGVARHAKDKPLVAVQIDAHADLRDSFEGSPYSHACAARRIAETCPVLQLGIRNISAEGDAFRRRSDRVVTVFAEEMASGDYRRELAEFVAGKTVYLTIDLDGLDPSIMPAVGTPEPGGLLWRDVLDVFDVLGRSAGRVAALDVVELAPLPGLVGPDFIAAKLVYEAATRFLMGCAGT